MRSARPARSCHAIATPGGTLRIRLEQRGRGQGVAKGKELRQPHRVDPPRFGQQVSGPSSEQRVTPPSSWSSW